MLWRHLFEETLTSSTFVNDQLQFERQIYAKIKQCEREDVIARHEYQACAEEWQAKIEKHGLLVQYLASEREKMLEKECQQCKGDTILPCVDRKSKQFVQKHFDKDMQFIRAARDELLK